MGWQDLKDLFFRRDAMPPPPTLLSVPYSAQLLRERAQLHDNNLQRTQAARDLRGGAKPQLQLKTRFCDNNHVYPSENDT